MAIGVGIGIGFGFDCHSETDTDTEEILPDSGLLLLDFQTPDQRLDPGKIVGSKVRLNPVDDL